MFTLKVSFAGMLAPRFFITTLVNPSLAPTRVADPVTPVTIAIMFESTVKSAKLDPAAIALGPALKEIKKNKILPI